LWENYLSFAKLLEFIETKFKGRYVVLFIDSCHSGKAITEIEQTLNRKKKYLVFTSKSDNEQGAVEWDFCDCLIECFSSLQQVYTPEDLDLKITAKYKQSKRQGQTNRFHNEFTAELGNIIISKPPLASVHRTE